MNTTTPSEKEEAIALRQKILSLTNTVPANVRSGSHNTAVAFKRDASKARAMANKGGSLGKMKEAWSLVSGYFGE